MTCFQKWMKSHQQNPTKKKSQEAIPRNEKRENGGRVWVIWKGATNLKFEMGRPEL